MNSEKFKVRSSMLGGIMPSEKPRSLFTQTQLDKLIELYNAIYFNRTEEKKNKYLDKGNYREADATTLVSLNRKIFFKQNTERLENDFVTGIPDLFTGESIRNADETIDTKVSWSKNTFDKARINELIDDYLYQGHGYMDLTGAKKHTVAFCLINGTAQAILNEKRTASYQYNVIDPSIKDDPAYVERCKQIEINHIFDLKQFQKEFPYFEFDNDLSDWHYDIPLKDRLHTKSFDRDESVILKIHNRIEVCRQYLIENGFLKSSLVAA